MVHSKSVLVVGGAGYIGSHMVLALKRAGFEPVVLDNLIKGHAHAVMGTQLIVGDMSDTTLLNELLSTKQFLAVMHFASFIEVGESMRDPAKYYQNNVAGTLALLDAMRKNHIPHIIFSSTAAVYGEPQYTTIDENHPINPINPYGRSKWMIEQIIRDYAASYGLNYGILRYFNAAGADPERKLGEEHEPESHLIPLILQVALGKKSHIHIYGRDYPTQDGTCIRDYIHVHDLCTAHLLALQALLNEKKNFTFNLGTGHGYSVQEVISTARFITHHPIPIIDAERRSGDPAVLVADPTRARETLSWQPQYSDLEMIIRHAWAFLNRCPFASEQKEITA